MEDKFIYKALIEFDDEAITSDDVFDTDTIMQSVKECITSEGIEIADETEKASLLFGTNDKILYNRMQNCLTKIKKSNVNAYINKFIFINNGVEEDILKNMKREGIINNDNIKRLKNRTFEVAISLDVNAIKKDDVYSVDTVYETIRNEFNSKGMFATSSDDNGELSFATDNHDKFALMGSAIVRCYKSPIKPYFKKIMFYNYETKTKSDYLKGLIRENV